MDRLFRILLGSACLLGCFEIFEGRAQAESTVPAATAKVMLQAQPLSTSPNIFNTVAVRIKAQRFWSEWQRARREPLVMSPRLQALVGPAFRLNPVQQMAYVQSTVTRIIGWRSDATQWGRHDYWASADETLARGLGDAEDRAILKMHALRKLGFSAQDLYLTLGRDEVGGPQSVLIVRLGNIYYVLDDMGGAPFTPDRRPEFKPALSFGFSSIWAHAPSALGAGQLR